MRSFWREMKHTKEALSVINCTGWSCALHISSSYDAISVVLCLRWQKLVIFNENSEYKKKKERKENGTLEMYLKKLALSKTRQLNNWPAGWTYTTGSEYSELMSTPRAPSHDPWTDTALTLDLLDLLPYCLKYQHIPQTLMPLASQEKGYRIHQFKPWTAQMLTWADWFSIFNKPVNLALSYQDKPQSSNHKEQSAS